MSIAAPPAAAPAARAPRAPTVESASGGWLRGLWYRQLDRYPETRPRAWYLAIVVITSVMLYYTLYVQYSVSTLIISEFHMSFLFFVWISVIGNAVGAIASLVAGLADRWGRANLVVFGVGLTGLLVLVGLPNAPSKTTYLLMFAVVNFVEGMVLVATPALMRDFSPQLGRASAMGFWTLGPVIGSLVVTTVSSNTLSSTNPQWRSQFEYAGVAALVVFVVALFGLRELSPRLRDQLMVSLKDKVLIEARAAGLDVEKAQAHPWRQMLRPDVIGSAFGISVFLIFYYSVVGYFVLYYATAFGYSAQRANALANWYWAANAIALVLAGVFSDKVRVRKPFMVVGALGSIVLTAMFAVRATSADTSYYTFALIISAIAVFQGIAYAPWMASFTETVEKHNPAATATGLAVWGWTIRVIVAVSSAFVPIVVTSATTLVDTGPRVQAIVSAHPKAVAILSAVDSGTAAALAKNPTDAVALPKALGAVAREQGVNLATAARVQSAAQRRIQQLRTAGAIDKVTLGTLTSNPTDGPAIAKAQSEIASAFKIDNSAALQRLLGLAPADVKTDLALVTPYANALQNANTSIRPADLAFLSANGTKVATAQKHVPTQWRNWWWITVAAQLLFLPFIFVMTGRWRPKKARQDAEEHALLVEREIAALTAASLKPVTAS